MILPPIDHVTNIYGFIYTSASANNSQTWDNSRPICTDFANDNEITTYWSLDGFTLNSERTITTKLDRLLGQHILFYPADKKCVTIF